MKDGAVGVGIAGAGNEGAFRATAIEAALAKSLTPAAVDPVEIDVSALLADIHATAAYRANLVKVMAKRACRRVARDLPLEGEGACRDPAPCRRSPAPCDRP